MIWFAVNVDLSGAVDPRLRSSARSIRLPWLTDLLRDSFTKIAADVSRKYESTEDRRRKSVAVYVIAASNRFHHMLAPRKNAFLLS